MNGVERGTELETEWKTTFSRWAEAFPADREQWDAAWEGRIGSWELPEFEAGEEIATRDAGKKVMQAFKHAVPTMIGGAADLVESTKTEFEGGGLFSDRWSGRNIPFGIREHAMGSAVNGIGVHGGCVKPYGSTFLIFSDYMRPAVRLAALMKLPVVYVWTHDSVGLGEDGPTHQPVETYAALRAIPVSGSCGRRTRTRLRQHGRSRSSAPTAQSHSRSRARRSRRSTAPIWRRHRSSSAAPTRSGSRLVAGPDLDRHRRRGRADAGGRPQARGGRDRRARRLDAVLGALRGQPTDYRDEVLPPR